MGYTHYWKIKKTIPEDAWRKIRQETAALMIGEPICNDANDNDSDPPVCDDSEIRFNGLGEDAHETFLLTRNVKDFDCCKTAVKPYDRVVCAVLAIAKDHAPDCIEVSSDGDVSDWLPAINWVRLTLGRSVACPI